MTRPPGHAFRFIGRPFFVLPFGLRVRETDPRIAISMGIDACFPFGRNRGERWLVP